LEERPLFLWQLPAIEWVEPRDCAAILMRMRLGKITVARYWAAARDARRFLVVTPIEAMAGWHRELTALGENFEIAHGPRGNRIEAVLRAHESYDGRYFILTNSQGLFKPGPKKECADCKGTGKQGDSQFDLPCLECGGKGWWRAPAGPTDLATLKWDGVIWDESTVGLRNPKSQTCKIAMRYLTRARYRCILSGDFAPEGPLDIFQQMCWCYGEFMGHDNFWEWRDAYFLQDRYDWYPKMGTLKAIHTALEELAYRLDYKAAGVRWRVKRRRVECSMPDDLREKYNSALRWMEVPTESGEWIVTKQKMVVGQWLAQLAGGVPVFDRQVRSDHKLHLLLQEVARVGGRRCVVTFRYNPELFAAADLLEKSGFKVRVVWGEIKPKERYQIEKEFHENKFQVLLMQVRVARFGIDLSCARHMIRFSLPWEYESIHQPMLRIFNPMLDDDCIYTDLVCRDTPDEDLYEMSIDKGLSAGGFMNDLRRRIEYRVGQGHEQQRRLHGRASSQDAEVSGVREGVGGVQGGNQEEEPGPADLPEGAAEVGDLPSEYGDRS